jgi:rhamnosyltransferase subunit B
MKVLLVTIGSHGDVHPFVGMGIALRKRGHDVILMTNGYFEPLARSAGLEFAPLGTEAEFRELIKDPDLWHPRKSFEAVFCRGAIPLMEPTYQLIEQHNVPGETVVVAACLALGAIIAHEKLGIPTASAHTAPIIMRTIHDVPKYPILGMPRWSPKWLKRVLWAFGDRFLVDPLVAPAVNKFRAKLGLTQPVKGILNTWWHAPQLVMGMWPEWFAPTQPDWPKQFKAIGFPLFDETGITPISTELDAWLGAGDAPIAFTPGSAMVQGKQFFEESTKACVQLNRRGILLTRHPEQIPPRLPSLVRHVDYAPFTELLPRCAALVHHGGIGTTAQALRAGCPQLIMPMAHDQFDNALRVTKLGVGASISVRGYRATRIAEQLKPLLESRQVRERCAAISRQFLAINPLEIAANLIEELGGAQVPENAVIREH